MAEVETPRRGLNDPRAILFDLDGTLMDTTELILECFHHSWRTVCGYTPPRDALIETFGIPLREAMRRLLGAANGDGKIEALLVEYRRFNLANHDLLARPFAGVQRVVETLKGRGYLLGVVSSKSTELGTRGLKLAGLDSHMDTAVFLEDTARHKPHSDPVREALIRLSVPASAAAYVGDSPHDIVSGKAAGVRTVAALWGPVPKSDLEREKPDYLVNSAEELLQVFV